MSYLKTVGGPGVQGLHPQEVVVQVKNANPSGDFVPGDICQFDFVSGVGGPGVEGSGFYTVKTPFTDGNNNAKAHRSGGVFGVCQVAIAAGATGTVMVSGFTSVRSASATKGDLLVSAPGGTTVAAVAITPSGTPTNCKIIAHVVSVGTGAGEPAGTLGTNSATFPLAWFDGLYGFGANA
jgi:hypothetical protein